MLYISHTLNYLPIKRNDYPEGGSSEPLKPPGLVIKSECYYIEQSLTHKNALIEYDDETIMNNNENTSAVNLSYMRPHRLVPTMETSVGLAR